MAWASFRLSGWAPDVPADATPPEYWSDVYNAYPQDGLQTRSVGDNDVAATGTPITRYQWFHPIRNLAVGTDGIVYAGNDVAGPRSRIGIYLSGVGHIDVTPGAWAASPTNRNNTYTGGALSTGVLVNDQLHACVWVDAVTLTAGLILPIQYFQALRPYRYHAVGIGDRNVAGGLNTVRWTNAAVPGAAPTTWTPAAGNDAGSFDVTAPGQGVLVDGGQLGEDFIIYGENSSHLMTYVGGQVVMASRRLSANTGILTQNCWADVGNAHVVLTRDDIILINQAGVVRSIADSRIRRTLFQQLYQSDGRQLGCQVWNDRQRNRVWIVLPALSAAAGAPAYFLGRAYIYDLASDAWGYRELNLIQPNGVSFGAMASLELAAPGYGQPRLIVANAGAGAGLAQSYLTFAETDTASTSQNDTLLQKDDLDLGDAGRLKLVTGLRLRGKSVAATLTFKVSIGTKNAMDAAYTYTAEQDCVWPTTQRVPFLALGRWISVKIRLPGGIALPPPSLKFSLSGFDLEYQPRGQW